MIGWILKKAFGTAVLGGTAATAYAYREEIGTAVSNQFNEVKNDPKGTLEGISNAATNLGRSIGETASNIGDTIDGTRKDIEETVETIRNPLGAFSDAANGEEKGFNWMKWLGIPAAGIAGFSLLKNFFGKDDKSENNSSGMGIVGTLAIVGAVLAVAMDWGGVRTKISNAFNNISGASDNKIAAATTAEQGVRMNPNAFRPVDDGPAFG